MADASPIPVWCGDTWTFPCTLSAAGTPVDMTGYTIGGELFFSYQSAPIDLTLANGGAAFDSVMGGSYHFTVRPDQQLIASTIAQDPATAKTFPTRIQVWDIDTLGRKTTRGIILILPKDPRSA